MCVQACQFGTGRTWHPAWLPASLCLPFKAGTSSCMKFCTSRSTTPSKPAISMQVLYSWCHCVWVQGERRGREERQRQSCLNHCINCCLWKWGTLSLTHENHMHLCSECSSGQSWQKICCWLVLDCFSEIVWFCWPWPIFKVMWKWKRKCDGYNT